MKTTIEIDIPDGYEFVRIGRVCKGEKYLFLNRSVTTWKNSWDSEAVYVIVRNKITTGKYKVALMRTHELEFTTTQDFNNNFNNVENNKYFVKWITKDWVEYEV